MYDVRHTTTKAQWYDNSGGTITHAVHFTGGIITQVVRYYRCYDITCGIITQARRYDNTGRTLTQAL